MQVLEKNQTQLTASEQTNYQNVASSTETMQCWLVAFGDPASYHQNGNLQFNLPTINHPIHVDGAIVEYSSSVDFSWTGGISNVHGNASIFRKDFGVGGYVQLAGSFFNIVPISPTRSVLQKIILQDDGGGGDGCDFVNTSVGAVDFCDDNDDCTAFIDVLVLLPQDVRKAGAINPSVRSNVIAAMNSVKGAFQNSEVFNRRIRWNIQPFSFVYNLGSGGSPSISIDLDSLVVRAAPLKAAVRADLVIMFTNQVYSNARGSVRGTGGCPSPTCAFGIVNFGSALAPTFTLAHEMAHFFGAGHNWPGNCSLAGFCGNDSSPDCAHGLVFTDVDGVEHRTLMAVISQPEVDAGLQRELNYSNPDVSIIGGATGEDLANNAKQIRNAACVVDDHMGSGQWSAGILASTVACNNDPFPLNSVARPPIPGWGFLGLPPYSYQWHLCCSPDFDNNPIQNLGTQPTATVYSHNCGSAFWIRLVVTSADGQEITEKKKITVANCLGNPGGDDRNAHFDALSDNSLKVFPNPASTNISIKLPNGFWDIMIIDQIGRVCGRLSATHNQTEFSTAELHTGHYTIVAKGFGETLYQKFIVSNPKP